jgi:predicted N-acyltransferase
MKIKFVNSINEINELTWQKLADSNSPLVNYNFYNGLENSQSVGSKKGWQPHHLVCSKSNKVNAILPMYIKQHSWGEYVFDWAWADAYQQQNEPYYPKLVATIPFTPISTPKLITSDIELAQVFSALSEHCQEQSINSWHILYAQESENQSLASNNIFERNTVQFHWFNHQYHNFDDFLSVFTARKRKNVKKERLSISQQNIKTRRILGKDITPQELDFFYLTYQLTYLKRGHSPHLTADFFAKVLISFPDNVLLVIASIEGCDIACSWFFFDEHQLYGRYWGCTQKCNNLHFELCYYQGIEFCIERKLNAFNPGAQGEHKIQRGFEPVLTHSYHWIKHNNFRPAIQQFCQQEQYQMQQYLKYCQQFLPFKAENKLPQIIKGIDK